MFAEDDPRWDLFDAQASWHCCGQSVNPNTPKSLTREEQFQRGLHLLAACDGALDMSSLHCNGQRVAAAYGYHHDGIAQVLQIHVNARFQALDPGTLLLYHMVRDSLERSDRRIDLVGSGTDVGQLWRTRTLTNQRFMASSPVSLRGRLLRASGVATHMLWARHSRPPF